MKILASILVIVASAACLAAQEGAPKRKTSPPTEKIVEGFWVWSRGSKAIVKIPRETIEATLADESVTVKEGNKNIPIQILPAGTKLYIKLRQESSKFTILELGKDKTDVTPVAPPPAGNSNPSAK